MLDRLIVGLAEFSRRHALAVALGGLLLAAVSAFYAVTHLDVSTDTDRMFSGSLPWRQQADKLNKEFPQFNDLLVVVIDAREPEQADATAAALAFQLGPPAGRVALPAQRGPAVPRHEAVDRPDGPYH
jgi:predicted RND superfamily exporter protein